MRSLPDVYVVGGVQRPLKPGDPLWGGYQGGVVLRLCLATGRLEECLRYQSPPEVCPDEDPSILFKAATLHGDRIELCTTTEIMTYSLPGFEQLARVSLPCFNDIHHVAPAPDGGWPGRQHRPRHGDRGSP